jgi:protein-L-isoaspartate O-methyltransferase
LVSAAAKECYPSWKEQLKTGGRIVAPISNSIWLFVKKSEKPSTRAKLGAGLVPHRKEVSGAGEFEEFEYPGFVFVPLIEK